MTMTYKEATLALAKTRAEEIAQKFIQEVNHLLNSGAVDSEYHSRGLLYGVAIENIADGFLSGERKNREYKNLKCF